MDLRSLPAVGQAGAGLATGPLRATTSGGAAGVAGNSFGNALQSALRSVSQSQNEAGELQKKFQMGVEGVSLEDTMVSMQKAQVGFQAALTVRNRLVSAYTDIMNMQV